MIKSVVLIGFGMIRKRVRVDVGITLRARIALHPIWIRPRTESRSARFGPSVSICMAILMARLPRNLEMGVAAVTARLARPP